MEPWAAWLADWKPEPKRPAPVIAPLSPRLRFLEPPTKRPRGRPRKDAAPPAPSLAAPVAAPEPAPPSAPTPLPRDLVEATAFLGERTYQGQRPRSYFLQFLEAEGIPPTLAALNPDTAGRFLASLYTEAEAEELQHYAAGLRQWAAALTKLGVYATDPLDAPGRMVARSQDVTEPVRRSVLRDSDPAVAGQVQALKQRMPARDYLEKV